MNSIRKATALLATLVISLASLPAVTMAPAWAEPTPGATTPATAAPTAPDTTAASAPAAPDTTPASAPTGTPAPAIAVENAPATPAPTDPGQPENPGGAPTSVHTFETPLPTGNKGAASAGKIATEAYSLDRSGVINVRVVKVQLADRKAAISDSDATSAVGTAKAYWEAMSNGRLSMNVGAPETWTSKATSTQRYPDMMNTIAGELNWPVNPNPWTALVVFVSTSTLSDGAYGAGWSYNGTSGRVLMPLPAPASLTNSVLTHEFGHVFGLMHANMLQCTDGAVDVATNPDGSFANGSCSIQEYKDTLDLMGASQASRPVISSPMWEYGGFGNGQEVFNAGTAVGRNSYSLKAWGGADNNRAVKFRDPVSGETYYLELRLPVGNDAATAVNGNRGVKIVQALGAGSIALPPSTVKYYSTYYSANQAWQPGQTFRTHAGTKVTIDWISDSAAGVTIDALPPTKPALVSPGDFNGDGIPDLIQRKTNGELWFYPGDGTGKSLPGRKIGWGWDIYDSIFGTGDFNGDGKNDLVARKFDGSLWFYAGTGAVSATSEGYRAAVKIGDFGWDGFDALVGVRDFDGDGRPDILARRPDGVLLLYPGNGSGRPGTPRQIDFGWQIFDQLIPLQDFNGDGTNDLAGRRPDGTLWFYANTGKAKFAGGQQIGTGWQIYENIVGVGDADGDRAADFVGRQPDGSTYFYAGTAMRDQGYNGARKIGDFGWDAFNYLSATKDFNGDSIADLLGRMNDGSLWFYPGTGSGAYGPPRKVGLFGWDVFDSLTGIGDMNGDGKNDLLARKPDGTLWLYPGTGRVDATSSGLGSATKIGDFGWEAFSSLTATGDLTGDGKNDLLARKADGSLWLYAGTGRVDSTSKGYLGGQKIGDFGWEAFDQLIGAGDFDSDGKNDVIARMPDGTLWLYRGDGKGRLGASQRIGTGWNIFDTVLGAGNLNADKFPDMVARRPDGSLWSYSGTGMQPSEGYLGRAYAAVL